MNRQRPPSSGNTRIAFVRSSVVRLGRIFGLLAGVAWISVSDSAADVTSTWNSSTGNWSDPTRWSSYPNFPNNGNGGNIYDAVINGGIVTLDQNIAIRTLNLNSAIDGSFDLSADTLNLNGTISGSGTTTVRTLNWSTGAMFGAGTTTIPNNGQLTFPNPGTSVQLYRTLVNNGSATMTDTYVNFGAGTFQNNGSFTVTENGFHNFNTQVNFSSNAFNNSGTFTKLGTGTTQFEAAAFGSSLPFNNTGVVDVQGGTLNLQSGVTQHAGTVLTGGVWRVRNGATLNFFAGGNPILTNFGNVTLEGTGNLPQIASLSANRGVFTIDAGKSFAASGPFDTTAR